MTSKIAASCLNFQQISCFAYSVLYDLCLTDSTDSHLGQSWAMCSDTYAGVRMCGDVYLTFWSQLMSSWTAGICIVVLISLTAQYHTANCIRIGAEDFFFFFTYFEIVPRRNSWTLGRLCWKGWTDRIHNSRKPFIDFIIHTLSFKPDCLWTQLPVG